MNPVALGFRFFESACRHDAAPRTIRLKRACQRLSCREADSGLQHLHDVIDRVILVVENDDMVETLDLGRRIFFHLRFEGDFS